MNLPAWVYDRFSQVMEYYSTFSVCHHAVAIFDIWISLDVSADF
jgi:hypothetical protein